MFDLDVTPSSASSPVGVPLQLRAIGEFAAPSASCDWNGWWGDLFSGDDDTHCQAGTTIVQLDVTQQVGWMVWPKRNGTVSNTDGSRGVVTMYEPSETALVLAVRWDSTERRLTVGRGTVRSP
jgi:hypothetical protein